MSSLGQFFIFFALMFYISIQEKKALQKYEKAVEEFEKKNNSYGIVISTNAVTRTKLIPDK